MTDRPVDVVIVGAGPAGTTLAAALARRGIEVVVLERSPAWRWRAGGVFSSPAAMTALERAGMERPVLERVARPIPAMRLETPGGAVVRLTYGAESGGPPAVGFDRSALDPALEAMALAAGAAIRRGSTVTSVLLPRTREPAVVTVREADRTHVLQARIVVGADGPRSIVATATGVTRPVRLAPRIGISYHVADPRPSDGAVDARLRVFGGGYVGLAPVPGKRVNVGIVLGGGWRARLAREGAGAVAEAVLGAVPEAPDDPVAWAQARRCDHVEGVSPLGGRVTRRAGRGWFLVGDAVGFLDPFTGEGLHRSIVSSDLAGRAIAATMARGVDRDRVAVAYDRAMRRQFAAKDAVSWLVQLFLARPALFEYAAGRLATRPSVRATMGLVMGDLVPAERGLDPRFLAALLAP